MENFQIINEFPKQEQANKIILSNNLTTTASTIPCSSNNVLNSSKNSPNNEKKLFFNNSITFKEVENQKTTGILLNVKEANTVNNQNSRTLIQNQFEENSAPNSRQVYIYYTYVWKLLS